LPIVRVREHVNPLSRKYQNQVVLPTWEEIYAIANQPLHLDIGCGRGRFLLELAQQQPTWNFLGLEIRALLVDQANERRTELKLQNLYYLFGNANTALKPLLSSLPAEVLQRVTIQFPDPWFKRRHQKRRVVQPELVDAIAHFLKSGGIVFLQSDVQEVVVDMCDRFEVHPAFVRQHPDWFPSNPMPLPTERETLTLERGEPVYRALFMRK
jgi:tRNA (guanine-N7-)-methyltransferase